MKLSKENFDELSLNDKGKVLFANGTYIAVRGYYNFKVQLYTLWGFFVEVWYHPSLNSIDKIDLMESDKTLNLYLSDIEILDLLK